MSRAADPITSLQQSIHNFCEAYKNRSAYSDICFQLEQALVEAEALSMSPGRKAAEEAREPVPSGQAPSGRKEAPMKSQSDTES